MQILQVDHEVRGRVRRHLDARQHPAVVAAIQASGPRQQRLVVPRQAVTRVDGKHIWVHDPGRGKRKLTLAEASRHFTGVAMEFTPNQDFRRTDEREKVN